MIYENKNIEKALTEMGFEEFTDIQAQTIPLIIEGKDVIGHSQTGTGKTAAYTLPILEMIDYDNPKIQAIILCPTRELVVQVKGEIDKIGKYVPRLKTVSVYGGEPISRQILSLKKKPQIIVGTPGRTIDHINRNLIKLQDIKFLVLDEADEMLKMGFKEDIETILENANKDRQTVMFSATMPRAILDITKRYMKNSQHISVIDDEETNKDITQYYYNVNEKNKVEAVARLLSIYNSKLTLVFCNTKRKVDDITNQLIAKGYNVDKIHGDLQQTTRLQVLNRFHSGVLDILVATDVAARGLDIKNVEVVINFDVPEKAEYYVHRIGRTGRIGNKGMSLTLVTKKEMSRLDAVMRFSHSPIKKRNVPTTERVEAVRQEKEVEDITNIILETNLTVYEDIAARLLEENEAVSVVSALLSKLAKNDSSSVINEDINEDVSKSSRGDRSSNRRESGARERGRRKEQGGHDGNSRSGGSRGGKTNKSDVRFHINLGASDGLTPSKFANFVSQNTNLRNSQIKDVTIRDNFSFFSTEPIHEASVMKKLKNVKFSDKKASVQIANDKRN
ncbi:MAG: DEAD/DEAH box helicase [Firmicutes bacterium]|nr:DEAD/DEAH box helicase [Bacillota bacterium]